MDAFKYKILKELTSPAWKWLYLIPFGLLGSVAFVRDELLSYQIREQYTLLNLLPKLNWGWYIIIIAILALIILFVSAYQATNKRDKQLEEILEKYSYSLKLENINTEYQIGPNQAIYRRLFLTFKNTIKMPIEYHVTILDIDGIVQSNFFNNRKQY
jgi:hypothetical protein